MNLQASETLTQRLGEPTNQAALHPNVMRAMTFLVDFGRQLELSHYA
ncbi:MAG: hypothetical protein KF760_19055 [Candidatus Eremiobacteraeota bacterium]|nr:hypothetical protein [Candidatus Eremiobacteraeota bacterium]MCW5870282.1 hypothetical protein [Candidatus Eremiobacteraeota bacterium]